ncbi:MAG TPA: C40 family peptidase [Steroidobacteraceae bacterium]|nr:C40 family peptidase [Steroidobacteraceae bacterium]
MRGRAATAAALIALLAAACTSVPRKPPPAHPDEGAAIAHVALSLVGTPYSFGGADGAGFDCSGLVLYVHEQVGLAVPRTALAQQHTAHPVPLAALSPGDVVFFGIRSGTVDHVGIYTGDGHFVHAPRAGAAVKSADLSGGFYAQHLLGAGRFWDTSASAR